LTKLHDTDPERAEVVCWENERRV